MLSITVSGNTASEISQRLRDAAAVFGASDLKAPSPQEKQSADTKSVQKAEQKAEKKSAPKVESKATSDTTLDHVAGKIAEICSNKELGKEKARELLAKFGAKKGGDLKPEQYADFVKQADAMLHPASDENEDLM